MYICIYVCMYTYIYMYVHIYVCICIYIYVYICIYMRVYIYIYIVVLGWIIPLCVGHGIEPATFRFQSKAVITPLPSLHSSSTFLLLSLSLSLSSLFSTLSVLLPSFPFHLLLLLAEKKTLFHCKFTMKARGLEFLGKGKGAVFH